MRSIINRTWRRLISLSLTSAFVLGCSPGFKSVDNSQLSSSSVEDEILRIQKVLESQNFDDLNVQEGREVTLLVAVTSDQIQEFSWQRASAKDGSYQDIGVFSPILRFFPAEASDSGFYRAKVVVSYFGRTRNLYSNSLQVTIVASNPNPTPPPPPPPVNKPPVAQAGPDVSAMVGDVITFDGSTSYDPDGDTLSYSWQITQQPQNSQATLLSANSAQPTISLSVAGTYIIELSVTDGQDISKDSLSINVASAPTPVPPANPGLVMHLAFNENSGSTTNDSAGSNHGTLMNMSSNSWVSGVSGSALQFDGNNDRVEVAHSAALNFGANQEFSISLWLKGSDLNTNQMIFEKRAETGYQLRYTLGEGLFFRIDEGPANYQTSLSAAAVLNGQWHHIVVGRNASQHFVYVDGQLANSTNRSSAANLANSAGFNVGGQLTQHYFNGSID